MKIIAYAASSELINLKQAKILDRPRKKLVFVFVTSDELFVEIGLRYEDKNNETNEKFNSFNNYMIVFISMNERDNDDVITYYQYVL